MGETPQEQDSLVPELNNLVLQFLNRLIDPAQPEDFLPTQIREATSYDIGEVSAELELGMIDAEEAWKKIKHIIGRLRKRVLDIPEEQISAIEHLIRTQQAEIRAKLGFGESVPQKKTPPPEQIIATPPKIVEGPIRKGHPLHRDLIGQLIDTKSEEAKTVLRFLATRQKNDQTTTADIVEETNIPDTAKVNYIIKTHLTDSRPFYVARGEKIGNTYLLHLLHTTTPVETTPIPIPANAVEGPITRTHPLYQALQQTLQLGISSEQAKEILYFLSKTKGKTPSTYKEIATSTSCKNPNRMIEIYLTDSRPFYVETVETPGARHNSLFLCYEETAEGIAPPNTVKGPIDRNHPLYEDLQRALERLGDPVTKQILRFASMIPNQQPTTYEELAENTRAVHVTTARYASQNLMGARPFYFVIRQFGHTHHLYLCYTETPEEELPPILTPLNTPSQTPLIKTYPQEAKRWLASLITDKSAAIIVQHIINTFDQSSRITYKELEMVTGFSQPTITRVVNDTLSNTTPFCLTKTFEGTLAIIQVIVNESEEDQEVTDPTLPPDAIRNTPHYLDWKTDPQTTGDERIHDTIDHLAKQPVDSSFPREEIEALIGTHRQSERMKILTQTRPIHIEFDAYSVITRLVVPTPTQALAYHPEYQDWYQQLPPSLKPIARRLAALPPNAIMLKSPLSESVPKELEEESPSADLQTTLALLQANYPFHLETQIGDRGILFLKLSLAKHSLSKWLSQIPQTPRNKKLRNLARRLSEESARQRSLNIPVTREFIASATDVNTESRSGIDNLIAQLNEFQPFGLVQDHQDKTVFRFVCRRVKLPRDESTEYQKIEETPPLIEALKQLLKFEATEAIRIVEEQARANREKALRERPKALDEDNEPLLPSEAYSPTRRPTEETKKTPLNTHPDFGKWRPNEGGMNFYRQEEIIQVLGEYPLGKELKLKRVERRFTKTVKTPFLGAMLRGLSRTSPFYVETFKKGNVAYIRTMIREDS